MEENDCIEVVREVQEELLKIQEDKLRKDVTLEKEPSKKKRFLGGGLSYFESDEDDIDSRGAAEDIY